MTRTRLPDRRPCETVQIAFAGHVFSVTVGLHPDTGQPLEVFADGRTSQLGHTIADSCVAISLALQHGCPAEALPRSMGRIPDPARGIDVCGPASPTGAIAEAVAAMARARPD